MTSRLRSAEQNAANRTGKKDCCMSKRAALDTARVFPVYIGNNELSPFHHLYASEDIVLRFAVGRLFAQHNGEDPVKGYWALRRSAALFDVPERPVELSGQDVLPFLERICARRIADLKLGRGRYVLLCTREGGLFMDGILFRLSENRFWFVQPDGDLDTWLLAHRHGYAVDISDPRSRVLQLQGPKSFEIIHAASGGEVDETMKYFGCGFVRIGGQKLFVSRTGWSGELGYEIYTLGDLTDCARLWGDLMRSGAERGLIFSAMISMNIRRIEAGILDSGSDFDTTMTPFEAGLDKFIDLEKEDFIGREALLTAPRRKLLFGVRTPDITPASGDLLLNGNNQVGRVTTGAFSPFLEAGIGYARFDAAGDWSGRTLTLHSQRYDRAICEIVELPFYDHEKRLSRNLPNADER